MSYCWHSTWVPAEEYQQFTYGNGSWPISQIMLKGLLDRRNSDLGEIWVDALCIDQGNEVEKRQAIDSMDIFDKSARLTVITLEDVRLSEEKV